MDFMVESGIEMCSTKVARTGTKGTAALFLMNKAAAVSGADA
jgi:hypothetical protein